MFDFGDFSYLQDPSYWQSMGVDPAVLGISTNDTPSVAQPAPYVAPAPSVYTTISAPSPATTGGVSADPGLGLATGSVQDTLARAKGMAKDLVNEVFGRNPKTQNLNLGGAAGLVNGITGYSNLGGGNVQAPTDSILTTTAGNVAVNLVSDILGIPRPDPNGYNGPRPSQQWYDGVKNALANNPDAFDSRFEAYATNPDRVVQVYQEGTNASAQDRIDRHNDSFAGQYGPQLVGLAAGALTGPLSGIGTISDTVTNPLIDSLVKTAFGQAGNIASNANLTAVSGQTGNLQGQPGTQSGVSIDTSGSGTGTGNTGTGDPGTTTTGTTTTTDPGTTNTGGTTTTNTGTTGNTGGGVNDPGNDGVPTGNPDPNYDNGGNTGGNQMPDYTNLLGGLFGGLSTSIGDTIRGLSTSMQNILDPIIQGLAGMNNTASATGTGGSSSATGGAGGSTGPINITNTLGGTGGLAGLINSPLVGDLLQALTRKLSSDDASGFLNEQKRQNDRMFNLIPSTAYRDLLVGHNTDLLTKPGDILNTKPYNDYWSYLSNSVERKANAQGFGGVGQSGYTQDALARAFNGTLLPVLQQDFSNTTQALQPFFQAGIQGSVNNANNTSSNIANLYDQNRSNIDLASNAAGIVGKILGI